MGGRLDPRLRGDDRREVLP